MARSPSFKYIFPMVLMGGALLLGSCRQAPPTRRDAPPIETTRAAFLKLLDRPRVAPAVQERAVPTKDGLTQLHISFAAEAGQRVPFWLVKTSSVTPRRPAVIVLHGTGGNKDDSLGLARRLARQGFIAIAMDGRFHGERCAAGRGTAEYDAAMAQAWRDGQAHPFLYDTVWDVMRLIDLLQARPDIDPNRLGVIGFSKGGMETYLLAAADQRVAVAIPCIGVQSWRYALDNNLWQARLGSVQGAINTVAREQGVPITREFVEKFYDRLVPGIAGDFDAPALLPLIAPRPLLVISGERDPRAPLPGVLRAADAARDAYEKVNAGERFCLKVQKKIGHAVAPATLDEAIAWFERWLLPGASGSGEVRNIHDGFDVLPK